MAVAIPEGLVFDASGLVPVIAQDRASGDVLMLAWADAEAIAKTAETGFVHFWSRSRKALWRKGDSSGHTLRVVEARADCDRDALLLVVEPAGPACHTGARTCFGETSATAAGMLEELARVVQQRAAAPVDASYTARLLAKGPGHVLKKIGEEATEAVMAGKDADRLRIVGETADLWFHCMIMLAQYGLRPSDVLAELARREGISGIDEKAARADTLRSKAERK